MRMFSDEKRSGTLEVLLTKPITELQIAVAKFLSAVVLVLLSLIPSLIYFYSVYTLGNPAGNVDMGGTMGSFIGLFFLASVYAAIGIFASSLTDNQIIAFLLATVLCFFFYLGFEYIGALALFGSLEEMILSLGINEHYKSISRGVVDLKDITYFLCVIALFIVFTRTVIQSRKWK